MLLFKQLKKTFFLFSILSLLFLVSCGDDDTQEMEVISITATDFSANIDENPAQGQTLGTIQASATGGRDINFSITSENPSGAMEIDAISGELTVANSDLFNFESNAIIEADIQVSANDAEPVIITAIITLTNLEIMADDFSTTIDENPNNGQVIGTIQASISGGGDVSFAIISQTPESALEIDAASGELLVADSSLFDFEANPVLEAIIEVTTEGESPETITATINLNDLEELGPGFVTTWQTTTANEDIMIPTNSSFNYNYDVDWGDGTISEGLTSDAVHTYTEAGIYQVSITGDFPSIFHGTPSNYTPLKLLNIKQWGNIVWESMEFAFSGCENMTYEATDNPDLSSVFRANSMFQSASAFNGDIGDWDVSNLTSIGGMFANTASFNKDISNWDVSNIVVLSAFRNARAFNQDIGNWDVSSATRMTSFFRGASAFDQNLGNWDISNVTDMRLMFDNSGMSIANYDATLIGWSQLATVPSNIELGAENISYSEAGEAARQFLIDEKGWNFVGDSKQ